MHLSIFKKEIYSPARFVISGPAPNQKPGYWAAQKYYWAAGSPVSIGPKPPDHICAESEEKKLDPLNEKFVEITCCPPPLFSDNAPEPLRMNPVFKSQCQPPPTTYPWPPQQPVNQVCLKTPVNNLPKRPVGNMAPAPPPPPPPPIHRPPRPPPPSGPRYLLVVPGMGVKIVEKPLLEQLIRKGLVKRYLWNSKSVLSSGKLVKTTAPVFILLKKVTFEARPPPTSSEKVCLKFDDTTGTGTGTSRTEAKASSSPNLKENLVKTTAPVVVQKKVTFEALPQPAEKDTGGGGTSHSEDKAKPPTATSSIHSSVKIASLEETFAALTYHGSPQLIPGKKLDATSEATNLFCTLCQRSYLTKTTYDGHLARHKKCKECGMDLRRPAFLYKVTGDTLKEYCATCAEKLKKGFMSSDKDGNEDVKEIKAVPRRRPPGRPRKLMIDVEDNDKCNADVKGRRVIFRGRPRKFLQLKQSFKDHMILRRRKGRRGEGNSFVCKKCGRMCSSRYSLMRHMKIHKDKDNPTCRCPVCGKWFRFEKNLAGHMTSHFCGGMFTCKICKRDFGSAIKLKSHQESAGVCSGELKKLKKKKV